MKFLSKITGDTIKSLLGEVGKFITTKEEKAKLNMRFTEIVNNSFSKAQEQLTERHKIDMVSDSWLSKNIRPMTLIFILLVYSLFSIADGNLSYGDFQFTVNPDYVELLGNWGKTIMYFYFGGRTIEKAVTLFKNK